MGVQWWYMYLRIGVGYRGENIHIGLTQRVDDGGLSPVHKMTNNMENLSKREILLLFFFPSKTRWLNIVDQKNMVFFFFFYNIQFELFLRNLNTTKLNSTKMHPKIILH